jgi:hypothetical protein
MRIFKGLTLAIAVLASANAFAARATLVSTIDRILVTTNGTFGNCMAFLNQPLASLGVDCPDQWVTFSCSGDFATVSEARLMFDTAQLALAMNQEVRIYLTDNLKHNGYCFASRIDLLRQQ